jgi:hypothetical protein
MPATLITRKGLKITDVATGVGGQALNENFSLIADRHFLTVPFCAVLSAIANTPPASPVDGNLYIVGAAPSGAWVGHARQLAQWYNGAWEFLTPPDGTHARTLDSNLLLFWDGTAWVPYQFGVVGALQRVQFRINYSGTNPVSVDPAEPAPAGWTVTFSGANMVVTHTMAKPPMFATYLGRNGALNALRYPTAVSQLSILVGEEATKFTCSVGTATTGAASGSSALVMFQF